MKSLIGSTELKTDHKPSLYVTGLYLSQKHFQQKYKHLVWWIYQTHVRWQNQSRYQAGKAQANPKESATKSKVEESISCLSCGQERLPKLLERKCWA